eukprot:1186989-Prorocentrum_minimum.AAC.2
MGAELEEPKGIDDEDIQDVTKDCRAAAASRAEVVHLDLDDDDDDNGGPCTRTASATQDVKPKLVVKTERL